MPKLDIRALFSRPGSPAYPFRDDRGQLCWLESLTGEGGRLALKQQTSSGERIITPPGFQVRSRVHEYGGKCFCVVGDQVYFNHYADGRIYCQSLHDGQLPVAVVEEDAAVLGYADLHYLAHPGAIVAVQEVAGKSAADNLNRLVMIPLGEDAPVAPQVLVSGADFYAAPCLSPSGEQIAWLQWHHPDMPWDASELMCGELRALDGGCQVIKVQSIAGGQGQSICQPGFLASGALVYAMDQDAAEDSSQNYWQLYCFENGRHRVLTQGRAEYGEAHWVFGQQRWAQVEEGSLLAIATRDESDQLQRVGLHERTITALGTPCARLSQLSAGAGVATCISEHSDRPPQIIEISGQGEVKTLRADEPWLDPAAVSHPEVICFPARDGGIAYANFYPATGVGEDTNTALLVLVHGGPTARADTALKPLVQYFAQNGFAVLDVNHRGSTGHGRAYRQALLGGWGKIDADDIADAIAYICAQKSLDAGGVFIRGGSAGGYAVLRALTRYPALFSGGACYYGIGNLITLAEITHKFEAHYTDRLIGEVYTPQGAARPESRYRTRSPIFDIDRINSPLILFQGLDDKVVPPEVSREVVATLERNGVKHAYIEYEGEGHGFRRAETRIDALTREIAFYRDCLAGQG